MAPLVDVEITISSARDLKNVNWKHGDLCAYAVAWIEDGGVEPIKMTTKVDGSGDTNPSWGQKFTLSATKEKLEDARLVLEVYHDKAEDAAKAIVGSASLPLLEVVDAGGYDEAQDYTMKLKRPSGRPHGKLELVIRLKERRGAYGVPPPGASPYGQRDWQSAYPGYSPPSYPAQPGYAQPYPAQAYPYGGPSPYGAPPQPYGSYAPPQPYGSYAPPQPYGAPPHDNFYSQPPPPAAYQETPPPQKQGSKFGGIGTGLAVGALAGGVGALALGEYIDHKEDEAAEEQAEDDAERYEELEAARDDGYGGGDDGGYGDDDY